MTVTPAMQPPPALGSGPVKGRYACMDGYEPLQPCDDPITQDEMGLLHAGAIGWGIGMLGLIGVMIWAIWRI